MTDWQKHGFGPGTDVCCRCKGAKPPGRRRSKWCAPCDAAMRSRNDGALDRPKTGVRVTRQTRVIK